jgi:hypothetical protein
LFFARRTTTLPVTLPPVPGTQPRDATSSVWPPSGSTSFMFALPRCQPMGTSHGSSRTFSSPYAFILSAVHLFARSRFFEPVSRGPMMSDMYWRFFISSERSLTSATSNRSTSAAAMRGAGATSAGAPTVGLHSRKHSPPSTADSSTRVSGTRGDIGGTPGLVRVGPFWTSQKEPVREEEVYCARAGGRKQWSTT